MSREMSTTDPLREVLEEIAAMPAIQVNPDGDDHAAATMQLIAREVLAAAPAERYDDPPDEEVVEAGARAAFFAFARARHGARLADAAAEAAWREVRETAMNDARPVIAAALALYEPRIRLDERRHTLRSLAAVPVEPEAWEWRVAFRTHFGEIGHSVGAGGSGLTEATAQRVCGPGCWIERRRAPGPWERVDPEPREEPNV